MLDALPLGQKFLWQNCEKCLRKILLFLGALHVIMFGHFVYFVCGLISLFLKLTAQLYLNKISNKNILPSRVWLIERYVSACCHGNVTGYLSMQSVVLIMVWVGPKGPGVLLFQLVNWAVNCPELIHSKFLLMCDLTVLQNGLWIGRGA